MTSQGGGTGLKAMTHTVNVDIFVSIHFRELTKIGNVAWTRFTFVMLLPLCGIIQVIFKLYLFSRIFEKRE